MKKILLLILPLLSLWVSLGEYITDTHGFEFFWNTADTDMYHTYFHTNKQCTLVEVWIWYDPAYPATRAFLYESDGTTLIEQTTVTWQKAQFNSILDDDTTYVIGVDWSWELQRLEAYTWELPKNMVNIDYITWAFQSFRYRIFWVEYITTYDSSYTQNTNNMFHFFN